MKFYTFEKELSRLGLSTFTIMDAARITRKKPAYVKLYLGRALAQGRVLRLERGKFALPDLTPFELADGFAAGYVSFLSALAFHGLSTQVPRTIQVACRKPKSPVTVGENTFAFIRLPQNGFFGFKRYGNVTAAEPEKAVLDGLYLPAQLPLDEAKAALDVLDIPKLKQYAQRFDSSIVAKRLGFLLERSGLDASGLESFVRKDYGLLNPALPDLGRKNRKWRIIENEAMA